MLGFSEQEYRSDAAGVIEEFVPWHQRAHTQGRRVSPSAVRPAKEQSYSAAAATSLMR